MSLDELEALRLAHLEELYQEEAAARMGVSRATLGNILASARRKAADMLVHGKMIVIEGGTVAMNERAFICSACGHGWSVPHGKARPSQCPACGSAELHRKAPAQGKGPCRGNTPCPRRSA